MKQIRNFFSKSTRKKMIFRGECWGFMMGGYQSKKKDVEGKRKN